MKSLALIATAATVLFAAGCNKSNDAAESKTGALPVTTVTTEDAAVIVNGKPISKASVEIVQTELGQRRGANNIPEDKIVEELIKRELLSQEAMAAGLGKDPKFAARLENAQRMVLSQVAAENFIQSVQVGDDELKKEYDKRIGPMAATEYKARHILVESEKVAKDLIAKLEKGEKFDALAKKFSKDPGSKDNGGDLGWFNPQQMVPPFAEAVKNLKDNETTKAPVQSQFGWHVIKREGSRQQTPPPFDAVKEQLKSLVQTQKLQQHIADLQAKAKIENRVAAKPAEPAAPATGEPAPQSLEAGKPAAPAPKPAAPAPAH
jgi:peptidyl-prolyl cis-trans isomerase C